MEHASTWHGATPLDPTTVDELRDVLHGHHVWAPAASIYRRDRINDLWDELTTGSARLMQLGNRLGRVISTASVEVAATVARRVYHLVEDRQELTRGGVIEAPYYPIPHKVVERLCNDEAPETAGRRGLLQQLGVSYKGDFVAHEPSATVRNSVTFDGLTDVHHTYPLQATFGWSEWNRGGYSEQQRILRAYYSWQEQPL